MDYYKCENCGKVFDEFEMNYRAAQVDKKCWCRACREAAQHRVQSDGAEGCWLCGKPESDHPSAECMSFIRPAANANR